jgi:sialate O-acetylesterase
MPLNPFQKARFPFAVITIITIFGMDSSYADVSVPPIFADHAILQVGEKTPVWGWAEPNEAVKVSLGGAKAETKAGADGKWSTLLSLKQATSNPQDLVIEGKNKLTFTDVLVGEVWICSGQSNMEWILKNCTGAPDEIAQSANPLLRQFMVKKTTSPTPQEKGEGKWTIAGPETSADFTAVGYYFGKKIQKELQVPVALLHTSWGGTPAESWTSDEGFKVDSTWNEGKEKQLTKVAAFEGVKKQFMADFETWTQKTNRTDKRIADPSSYAATEIPVTDWTPVKIPGDIAAPGIPAQGAIWVRRTVDIPASQEGKNIGATVNGINAFEEVYWNGTKIWEMKLEKYPGKGGRRDFTVEAKNVKAGKNTIAFRLYAPLEKPNFSDLRLNLATGSIALGGEWMAKAEYELPPVNPSEAGVPIMYDSIPLLHYTCTYLFNAMLHPWIPYGIRGANWYQGEANAGRAVQYKIALGAMIQDWRKRWNQGDFFFNICQLANMNPKKETPGESTWAELRDSQTILSLTIPQVGLANLIDLGESGDIHPRNKRDVGERLALNALAKVYGKSVPFTGPLYDSMKVEGEKIRIQFKNIDGGLVAKPLPETYIVKSVTQESAPYVKYSPQSELQGFVICGEDKVWKWANAKIENNTVVVSSPEVPKPIAVRYAWADNPTCNLYSGAGLPAVSFRTDDFPKVTEGKNL